MKTLQANYFHFNSFRFQLLIFSSVTFRNASVHRKIYFTRFASRERFFRFSLFRVNTEKFFIKTKSWFSSRLQVNEPTLSITLRSLRFFERENPFRKQKLEFNSCMRLTCSKPKKTHKAGEGATKRAKNFLTRFIGIKVILRKDSLRLVDAR